MTSNRALARHATRTAIAALAIDAAYTTVWWLILGRDERRNGRYPELKYALIIGQLSVEAAAIAHLIGQLRKVQR